MHEREIRKMIYETLDEIFKDKRLNLKIKDRVRIKRKAQDLALKLNNLLWIDDIGEVIEIQWDSELRRHLITINVEAEDKGGIKNIKVDFYSSDLTKI